MKTYKNLFVKLYSYDNLSEAIDGAIQNRKSKWQDCADIRRCRLDKNYVIKTIQKQLFEGTYNLTATRTKTIHDVASGKYRDITCPRIMYDQIYHHAIVQVLQPIISKGMYQWSCANVKGRGIHYAKKYVQKSIQRKENMNYWMKLDIHHYFLSIPHDKLYALCCKSIKDDKFLRVIKMLIDCYDPNNDGHGIPIGFYTSQWLSNWYLQGLDHYIVEQLPHTLYCRYADDMVLFAENKEDLHRDYESIKEYLKGLGLELNEKWQIAKFHYVDKNGKEHGRFLDFVGYRFYCNRTTLRASTFHRALRKFNRMQNKKVNWYNASQTMNYLAKLKDCDLHNLYITCKNQLPYDEMKRKQRIHSIKISNENKVKELKFESLQKDIKEIFG